LPLHSKLLYDPQTSGGLIIIVEEEDEGRILEELKESYPDACKIGRIVGEGEIGGIGAEEVEGTCTVKKLVKLEF
jgi:selenophosphate synthase